MASKRLNVLVYNGPGATQNALRHALFTLRRLLTPAYAVLPISTQALLNEPWQPTCALLVMPGGADQAYCNALNGAGNRRIRAFVERGGAYLGLCAGGYYGTSRCEFELGRKGMEVIGNRELGFFPGTCRGCAFAGFRYETEEGTRAALLRVERGRFQGRVPDSFRAYYNGGGIFVGADGYRDKGVEVLARFAEVESIVADPGEYEGAPAAVVYCKVGEGGALMMSPHPEFSAPNLEVLHWKADPAQWQRTMENIKRDEQLRSDFMRGCLAKLGLIVSDDPDNAPSLSKLYLSSHDPEEMDKLMWALRDIITSEDGQDVIRDDNDTFSLEKPETFSMGKLQAALDEPSKETPKSDDAPNGDEEILKQNSNSALTPKDQIVDYATVIKPISIYRAGLPSSKETPYFNHSAYFNHLSHYHTTTRDANPAFGANLLYGEVVTSTQTLLEKNTKLLRALPDGFLFNATTQVAGRGRGSNVWVSPAGTLLFSILLHHEVALQQRAPVVFIQYLAAMAVVDAVHTYDRGYQAVDIRLKWPNDIYAPDPRAAAAANPTGTNASSSSSSFRSAYTKIGGVLVNSHYSSTTYHTVMGLGLNLSNAMPTTSLNGLLADRYPHLAPFVPERLLARIVSSFSALYMKFRRTGFGEALLERYHSAWLHTGQIVSLEMEAGKRARIVGITPDWGLLVAEEVDEEGRGLGRRTELQSDSNSFDFFKGLVRRKI